MLSEPIAVTLLVIEALETLDVPYLIGGSLASAIHGVARATQGADLLADLRPGQTEPLALALGDAFYVDVGAIRDAIQSRRSFNIIHLETMFKVDVFVRRQRPFDQAQLEHRVAQIVATDPERTAYVASAEDTVLTKMEWFRRGGEIANQQWRDVMGVLRLQGDGLDREYLRRWAPALGIADLVDAALIAAARQETD